MLFPKNSQQFDFLITASLKPKWVLVKVPRKGALNIEMGRYGDSKNSFG